MRIAVLLLTVTLAASIASAQSDKIRNNLIREVRHELIMLPYYGVFDNLSFQVDGYNVKLIGQVTRPTLKSEAENVVKGIEGIGKVINEIVVLPLSPMDDSIRRATYRAIYGNPPLDRYALQAIPSIHIIVSGGKVTLTGVADSEADKNLAGLKANGVSGVFSVDNQLQVADRGKK